MKFLKFDKRLIENFNWSLLLAMLSLGAVGIINLYSVSSTYTGGGEPYYIKQAIFFTFGLFLMVPLLFLDYNYLKTLGIFIYIFSILLLIAVLLVGHKSGGAVRWLNLGFVKFQPGEPIKLVVIISLAAYFSKKKYIDGIGFSNLLMPILIAGVPFVLILMQPDLGTALHLAASCLPMILFLKLKRNLFITILILAMSFILFIAFGGTKVLIEHNIIKPYQMKRVDTFLSPEKDPKGAGWQVRQSQYAVGSGQLFGRGFMEGTQHKNGFLPVPESDFAFAALSEEWGFIGSSLVIGLFLWLIIACGLVAKRTNNSFGALLAIGLGSLIFWQMVINIGMVTGLLPVVGIPLPFISYGGSSMLVIILAISIVLNVSMRRYKFMDQKQLKQNPDLWKNDSYQEKNILNNILPVRRLYKYDSKEPDMYPEHRLPHVKPWLKHLKRSRRGL